MMTTREQVDEWQVALNNLSKRRPLSRTVIDISGWQNTADVTADGLLPRTTRRKTEVRQLLKLLLEETETKF